MGTHDPVIPAGHVSVTGLEAHPVGIGPKERNSSEGGRMQNLTILVTNNTTFNHGGER